MKIKALGVKRIYFFRQEGISIKLWIDDIRPMPEGFIWCRSVNEAKRVIAESDSIELIDIDHDAGDFVTDGGDYINLLNWLEESGRSYPIHIHSMNPVGIENMRRIIVFNHWQEVKP